jgi:hypothetical protein
MSHCFIEQSSGRYMGIKSITFVLLLTELQC